MSHSWELANFARDLSTLNGLICKYELPIETKELYSLEGKLPHEQSLEFTIENIAFTLSSAMSGTIPSHIKKFVIYFTHDCYLDHSKNKLKQDPYKDEKGYSFQINMVGYGEKEEKYNSWLHLDRQIQGGNKPRTCHPFYHFQFGGDQIEHLDSGQLMLMASPRIAHPPMDLFLGIHFILDNFFDKSTYPQIDRIMNDDDYKSIIINAQNRLWVPYFRAFSEGFDHIDYTRTNIFPLFVE